MRKPSESPRADLPKILPARWAVARLLVGSLLMAWVVLTAAPAGAQPAVSAGEPAGVGEEIVADYEALPLRGGVLLRPRSEDAPVTTIEVTEEGLAVDGRPVDARELRDLLGEDGGRILALVEMEPEERLRVLGLGATGTGATEAPVAGPDAPETPEDPEAPEAPEAPEKPRVRIGEKVSLASGVTIEENESARETVVIGGSLRVEGEVEREAVVIGGNAHVNGRIGRELMVVGGNVHLGPDAHVGRDINIVGGQVFQEEGARVDGRINEIGMLGPFFGGGWNPGDIDIELGDRRRFRPLAWFSGVMESIFAWVILALCAAVAVLFAQGFLERVEDRLVAEPWKAGAVGVLFQILIGPLLLVSVLFLLISIIGIPLLLLVPVAIFVLFLAAFLGFVAAALRVGRVVLDRFERPAGSVYVVLLTGLLGIGIWSVVASVLDVRFLGFVSGMLAFFGFLVYYGACTFGGGAVLLYFLGGRRRERFAGPGSPGPRPPVPPSPERPDTPGGGPPTEAAHGGELGDAEPAPPPEYESGEAGAGGDRPPAAPPLEPGEGGETRRQSPAHRESTLGEDEEDASGKDS